MEKRLKAERFYATAKSDYTYHINTCGCIDVLVIYDLDKGGMSVTNNVKTVLSEIESDLGRSVQGFPIIYRDSLGDFDGIRYENDRADIFNLVPGRCTTDETAALSAARSIFLQRG